MRSRAIVAGFSAVLVACHSSLPDAGRPGAEPAAIDARGAAVASPAPPTTGLGDVERWIADREYQPSPSAGGLQAPNRAHDLRAWFEPHGIRVHERSGEGRPLLDLKLSGVGRAGAALREPPAGDVVAEGARVEIRRPGLVEWYVNGPAGLEQGFTIAERPPGRAPLALELVVTGAQASLDGDAVRLATTSGRRLRYGGLVVRDAAGREQPARLEVASAERVRIVADDAAARYPLVIDPILAVEHSGATLIESDQSSAYLGMSVAGAGDVNGDGFDDVLVGAPGYDAGQVDEGAAFLFLGSAAGVSGAAAARLESNQADAGVSNWAELSVAGAGDVNADGYGDVIVGFPNYDTDLAAEGIALVFHGSAAGIPNGDPSTASIQLESGNHGALFGASVASAGDVNADGHGDLLVGAPHYGVNGGGTGFGVGAAFVFHGSASGVMASPVARLDSDGSPSHWFGHVVAGARDINGDGYDDALVGARGDGAVFAFLGASAGIPSGTAADAATRLAGLPDFTDFKSAAGAGDVNGDGFADVIVGVHADCGCLDGAALVFLGSAAGIPHGDATTAATRLIAPESFFGRSVGSAEDVNGDGYDDVIVGAGGCEYPADKPDGAFVFLGGPAGIADGGPATAASQLAVDPRCFSFGDSVAGAGDVNGDGRSDVIVGAPSYYLGAEGGAAYVFLGGACGNGLDDDSDGLTDAPADPGCSSSADLWERGDSECDDGRDDDGDGLVDHPTDPGCETPSDTSERGAPVCDDGIDQDADGLGDFPADPGCGGPLDPSELGTTQCDNGADDDGDALVDTALDQGCYGPADDDERTGATCDDGFDNDGDGLVDDAADPGCESVNSSRENSQCQDGIDNDFATGIDFDGGASLNGGVPLAQPDPQCVGQPWRNNEMRACGLGAELALLLCAIGALRSRARRVRSERGSDQFGS